MIKRNSSEYYRTILDGKPLDGFHIPEEIEGDFLAGSLGDARDAHIGVLSLLDEAICDSGGRLSDHALDGFRKVFEMVLDSEKNMNALLTADLAVRRDLANNNGKKVIAHPAHDPKGPG